MIDAVLFTSAFITAAAATPPSQGPLPPRMPVVADASFSLYYLYWLIPVIQIGAVIHAIRTGRGRQWAWIILLFPVIGAVTYGLVEVLPDWRQRSGRGLLESLLNLLRPGREAAILTEQLEFSDTAENRRALAEAYIRAGRFREAIETYRGCLKGALQDDPEARRDLAAALLLAGDFEAAREMLEAVRQSHPGHMPIKREILYGRTLEGLGRKAEALKVYEGLAGNPRLDGEEARCRLAQLLEAGGERQRAGAIYAEILKRSKGFSRPFRRAQQEWISAARAGLRRTRSG